MASIPGGDLLSGILNVVAQSLLTPVMILLIIFIIFAIIEIGAILSEYTGRTRLTVKDKEIIIRNIAACEDQEQICQVINSTKLTKYDKELLTSIAKLDKQSYDKETREIIARNLLEDQEFKVAKTLEKTDVVAKVGAACGLLGTIIPMGPGLAALGTGDMQTLTSSLTIAFNTTTAGLAAANVCYVVAKVRRRWYEEEISSLYNISETILEAM